MAELVSGVASSDELQEYAWAVWRAGKLAPGKDKIQGRGSKAALRRMRLALTKQCHYSTSFGQL